MDFRHRLRLVRSWARWIIAGTVLAGIAAYLVSGILPRVYEADARLVVGQALSSTNPDPNQFAAAQQLSAAYVALAGDRPVLEAAMTRLGISMPTSDFAKLVSVVAVRDLPFIDVVGRSDSPEQAAAIANAMAAELIALSPALSGPQGERMTFIESDLKAIETQTADVRRQLDTLTALPSRTASQEARMEALFNRLVVLQSTYAQLLQFATVTDANRITIVQQAVSPSLPASPRPLFNVAIATSLAFLLGLGAAFLWERFDDRVKSPEDVETTTGLATIGLVPRMPGDHGRQIAYRLASLLYPRSSAAEAFRTIRTNIEFAGLDRGLRTILVTSSLSSEGKTVVAANLAVAFAQAGRRTILVDADLRRPNVHTIFGLPNELGLTDLVRQEEITVDEIAQSTETPNLSVVTAGTVPANPAELLGSKRMEGVVERLKASAEILIFDSPPATVVTDAALMAARADATVMVIQGHRTSRRVVSQGVAALAKVNAKVIGAVLNNVPGGVAAPYYGRDRDDAEARREPPESGSPRQAHLPAPTVDVALASPQPVAPVGAPAERRASGRTTRRTDGRSASQPRDRPDR